METQFLFFFLYAFFGFILVLCNKQISFFAYKLILLFTDKLQLDEFFIFKVDKNNKNSLIFITRGFTVSFGLSIVAFSIYHVIYL